MAENYCGKSCEGCSYQEILDCPGCHAGPGKRYGGDCRIKKCCVEKNHETCATCQINVHCGTYRARSDMPQYRLKERQLLEKQHAEALRRAPVFGRWFTVLFWLQIFQVIAGLMTNEIANKIVPGIKTPGTLAQVVILALIALILLLLSREEGHYRTAGWCILISGGLNLVMSLIPQMNGNTASLLLGIPVTILSLVGRYHEYRGHSAVLCGVDDLLAENWLTYWKWYIGVILATVAAAALLIIGPILGMIAVCALLIGAIAVGIWEMVLLYNTARAFREFE